MKVVWSPLAELRALEAVEYIAQDRPRMASRVVILTLRHVRRAWNPAEVDDA